MKKSLIVLAAMASMMYAECTVEPSGAIDVGWEAYKTPSKAGVKGAFDKVKVSGLQAGGSIAGLLKGSRVTIEAASVDSKNPGRDAKLATYFFGLMEGKTIEAEVVTVEGAETTGKVVVAITMNGVTKKVPMAYTATKSEVMANGYIDLADFSALAAVASINKACYELHQGKTWQDVAIRFTLPIRTNCP